MSLAASHRLGVCTNIYIYIFIYLYRRILRDSGVKVLFLGFKLYRHRSRLIGTNVSEGYTASIFKVATKQAIHIPTCTQYRCCRTNRLQQCELIVEVQSLWLKCLQLSHSDTPNVCYKIAPCRS
jgi:hypothetical protein